ncbi:MAG: serine hydrolase [Lachnospiraceae bacterium]|nr:serine hydrolase [Lachnospiraceae bacterium]
MMKRMTAILLVLVLIFSCIGIGEAASSIRLKKGSRGNAVKTLQTALKEQGYYSGKIDGVYGKGTVKAVKAFQRKNGLKADGIAGPPTQAKLYSGGSTNSSATESAAQSPAEDQAPQQQTAATQTSVPSEALSFLNGIEKNSGAVCGTLVLSKDGKTFLNWSFGGVDEQTCFRIASVTKWVTAIGLMTLYDQGKLDLDKDISAYLGFKVRNPAYPETPITARMLLSHTSSLSPDASNYHPDWARIGKKGYDPIFNESVEPGSMYAYADYNGALFGCLIEAISKQSVQNYLNSKVFKPLGLTAAYSPVFLPAGTVCKDLLKKNGKVEISVQKDRTRKYNNKADPKENNGYTVGKLYINAASMTKLAQMMLGGGELDGVRILKSDTVKLMESDQKLVADSPYGLSTVRLYQFDRGTWYGHQGRYSGLSSNVYYQRETGITMALIMNGYDYQLKDNTVMPAVSLLTNMPKLEEIILGTASDT